MKKLVATLLLAARMRPAVRFAARQLRRAPGPSSYTIRATSQQVLIRHDGDDPYVLEECFGRLRTYDPPGEVAELLSRRPPRRVLDLGANIGAFGLLALSRFPGCEVTGVEADPANAELHEACIRANGLADRWRLVRGLAASRPGKVRFLAGRFSRSRLAEPGDEGAIDIEAVDVFPQLQTADLVKIDIEGGEWELLGDPRFAALEPRAIVLEYHANLCPHPDPGRAALEALRSARLKTLVVSDFEAADPYEAQGLVWGWRD